MSEATGAEVGTIASRGLADPGSLTPDEIQAVCASALTQRPDAVLVVPDRSLYQRSAMIIRSLMTHLSVADHIVRPRGEAPIVASDVVSQLEALSQ
jgi:hypothetical protein